MTHSNPATCPTCTGAVALSTDDGGQSVCPICGTAPDRASEVSVSRPAAMPSEGLPFSPEFLQQHQPVGFLGRGAMGSVYLMRQVKLPRLVAVKVVADGSLSAEVERRLLNEARVLASLSHPNILQIYDVGVDGTLPYMVSEYVEGETLAARLVREPAPSLAACLRIAIPLLDGLRAAHKQGVVHRDLKPGNVFLTTSGRPKIGDFGLAKAQSIPSGTATGRIVGTPAYMSPEQCRGATTTPASDLYSVGVMLFEMVTRARPFRGPGVLDYLCQHTTEPAPRARALVPELPEALDAVIGRALEKDPGSRPSSAGDLRRELKDVYRTLSTRSRARGQDGSISAEPGRVLLERYELLRMIGQGGMGQVWLAADQARDGAHVALKLLPPELWRDPDARANLLNEANLSLKLAHPAIVRLMNLETAAAPFLVMEWVRGTTLAEVLAQRKIAGVGPLPPAEALALLEPLCAALDHAHACGVIHRDVKPSNVLIETGADGRQIGVKLGDFGIAAELISFRTRQTGAVPAGTLAYMSPEQLACQKLDGRADVYGLGATLHQMLTLQPPFVGGDLAWAIQHAPLPKPDGVPARVVRVLESALAKSRDQRPATATALADALRRALDPVAPGPRSRTAAALALGVAAVAAFLALDPRSGGLGAPRATVSPDAPHPSPSSSPAPSPVAAIAPRASPAPPRTKPLRLPLGSHLLRTGTLLQSSPPPSLPPSPAPPRPLPPAPSPSPSPSPPLPPSPSLPDSGVRDLLLRAATDAFRSGDTPKALAAYRDLIALDPAHVEAHRKIGQCHLLLGELEPAVRVLERAQQLAPDDATVLNTFAVALARAGDGRAVAMAERATAREPGNAEHWDTLGIALARGGRKMEARAAYRRALALDPQHSDAREGLARLGKD